MAHRLTDLERFIRLYRSVGLDLVPHESDMPQCGTQSLTIKKADYHESTEENPLIVGYRGFETEIYFDEKGKFTCQGIWE